MSDGQIVRWTNCQMDKLSGGRIDVEPPELLYLYNLVSVGDELDRVADDEDDDDGDQRDGRSDRLSLLLAQPVKEKSPKWSKTAQDGQKQPKMVKNSQRWSKTAQPVKENTSRWSKVSVTCWPRFVFWSVANGPECIITFREL